MILADKIITLRKKSGWSQEELAEKLGISRQSVSKWESGASIPDLDKIIKMSGLFGVSTDYLLKDEIEEIAFSETDDETDQEVHSVSVEDANTYMEDSREYARWMAPAVASCVIAPAVLFFMLAASTAGLWGMSSDMAAGFGVALLLIIIAIAVGVMIMRSMAMSKYDYLEKENISLEYGVKGIVQKNRDAYVKCYRNSITLGVMLCILGVVPLLIAGAMGMSDFVCICFLSLMLVLIAIGVYFFVRSGIIYGSFEKLLQEGSYSKGNKEIERKIAWFPGAYWCIAVAIFLLEGLKNDNWKSAGYIFPIAGVLYAAIYCIMKAVVQSRKDSEKK